MGFGHRVYRAEDPRARVLRRTAQRDRRRALRGRRGAREGGAGRAAGAQARPRAGDQRRVLVGGRARPRRRPGGAVHAMFTCARVAGWSAHILEQKREARLIRPTAKYVGPRRARRSQTSSGALRGCRAARGVLVGEVGQRRRRGAHALARPRRAARRPVGQREQLDAAVVLGGRRSTRPRASSRSTMPVTFELSHIERGRRARSSASARRAAAASAPSTACGARPSSVQRSPCGAACRR